MGQASTWYGSFLFTFHWPEHTYRLFFNCKIGRSVPFSLCQEGWEKCLGNNIGSATPLDICSLKG